MDVRRKRLMAVVLPLWLAAGGCSSFQKSQTPDLAKLSKPGKVTESPNPSTARAAAGTEPKRKENDPLQPSTLCALASVREQVAENPDVSFADAEQARAHARKAYQQAIATDRKYIPAYLGLAKSYASADDGANAIKMYEQAIEQRPRDPNLWYDKGLMQARFKEWDGAIASFQQAQKLDPDNRQYSRMMGMTQARAGKFDEAQTTLLKCMKEEEARYTLARMYQHLNRIDDAKEQLALALRARPTFIPASEMMQQLEHPTIDNGVTTVGHQEPAAKTD